MTPAPSTGNRDGAGGGGPRGVARDGGGPRRRGGTVRPVGVEVLARAATHRPDAHTPALYVADLRPDVQLLDGVTHPWVFLLAPVHLNDRECAEALPGSTVDNAYLAVLARIGRLVDRFHPRPIGVAWRHHGDHDRWLRLYTAHHLARLQPDDLVHLQYIG